MLPPTSGLPPLADVVTRQVAARRPCSRHMPRPVQPLGEGSATVKNCVMGVSGRGDPGAAPGLVLLTAGAVPMPRFAETHMAHMGGGGGARPTSPAMSSVSCCAIALPTSNQRETAHARAGPNPGPFALPSLPLSGRPASGASGGTGQLPASPAAFGRLEQKHAKTAKLTWQKLSG